MNTNIEQTVKQCSTCLEYQGTQPWETALHFDIPLEFHKPKTICSGPTQLQEEVKHLYNTLKKCKYPTFALNRV